MNPIISLDSSGRRLLMLVKTDQQIYVVFYEYADCSTENIN